jgi:hypothetical protein
MFLSHILSYVHSHETSVHDALIELSRRHEGKDTKPVVKLIFDRGNPKQVLKNHQPVLEAQRKDLGIPLEHEVKNIHLEVMVRLRFTHTVTKRH